MEVWVNEKLKWEHEPVGQFPVLPNFHDCFYNVWEHGNKCLLFLLYNNPYRKLKRGNSLLYHSVNSPYCSWWRIMAWIFPMNARMGTDIYLNESKSKVIWLGRLKWVWTLSQSKLMRSSWIGHENPTFYFLLAWSKLKEHTMILYFLPAPLLVFYNYSVSMPLS